MELTSLEPGTQWFEKKVADSITQRMRECKPVHVGKDPNVVSFFN